jgi:hypothetical protein
MHKGYSQAHGGGKFTKEQHQHYTMNGGGDGKKTGGMKYDQNAKKSDKGENKTGGMKVRMQGKGMENTKGQKAVEANVKGKFSDNYTMHGK